jgi:hypothetical protein
MPVPTSVIDSIAFPPLGSLNPVLDTNGPYGAGDHTLTTFTTSGAFLLPAGTYQVHGTYGVIVVLNGALPPSWGYDIGYDSGGALGGEGFRYHNRFCQLVPMHQVLSGFYLPLEYFDVHHIPDSILWPFRLIGGDTLGVHVSPGVAVDLFFLCVL